MVHNRLFFTQFRFNLNSKKNFRPQTSDDETILAEQTDYVWGPDWCHLLFVNIPKDISTAATVTVSEHKIYLRVTPLMQHLKV